MRRTSVLGMTTLFAIVANLASGQGFEDIPWLADWEYPGSTPVASGTTGSATQAHSNAVMVTADSFEDVVRFYEKKIYKTGSPRPIDPAAPPKRVLGVSNFDGDSVTSLQDDSARRPVRLRVLVRNRPSDVVTVVISRAEGEKQTHIAWTYLGVPGQAK